MTTVGILHPGAMGVTVAAACRAPTLWCSAGRSTATRERAESVGLGDAGTLGGLVARCDVIVAVCPPGEAGAVASSVAACGFDGVYVDANAVAPATVREIGARFDRFVDGAVIGPPAVTAGTTRLYLAGDDAATVARLWDGTALDARTIDGGVGAASSLKMVYATWTKIRSALLLGTRSLARAEGVEAALLDEWALSQPRAAELSESTARNVAPKAWRFVGEMDQIAASFEGAGLHRGFGEAAAEIYRRLDDFRDADPTTVELDAVIAAVLGQAPPTSPAPP